MKNKMIVGFLLLFVLIMISGCCFSHDWQAETCTTGKVCNSCGATEGKELGHIWMEATCTTAKICSVCGETDGNSLGHVWKEANYQQSMQCTVCGELLGDPIQADFDKYGISCSAEIGEVYPYVNYTGPNNEYVTTGRVIIGDYYRFTSDDMHMPLNGYEWITYTLTYIFDDATAVRYGVEPSMSHTDYYNIAGTKEDLTRSNNYTVNYKGVFYTECTYEIHELNNGEATGCYLFEQIIYVRVPIGYDGVVCSVHNTRVSEKLEDDAIYINDAMDEYSLFCRFDELVYLQ